MIPHKIVETRAWSAVASVPKMDDSKHRDRNDDCPNPGSVQAPGHGLEPGAHQPGHRSDR